MLQLNPPLPFMQRMFAEAAAMHASAIRLDVQPSMVFTNPGQPPDFTGRDQVVALSQQYHLCVADLLSIPWWTSACQQPVTWRADGSSRVRDQGQRVPAHHIGAGRACRLSLVFRPPSRGIADCAPVRGATGRSSASGRAAAVATSRLTRGTRRSVAQLALPIGTRTGLASGTYLLNVSATNAHGTGETHSVWLTVLP
jgi:hypothetical protein